MRLSLLTACLALVAFSQPVQPPVPVVVELFTSEGCSSCPPADALLSKLVKEQPVPGVQIIPLGMHVTYWDQLGWKDPFSLALATERQTHYSSVLGAFSVYTPQVVIDGREEIIGSDEAGVRKAIARALRYAHARVHLRTSVVGDSLTAEATIGEVPPDLKEKLHAWLAITEDGLTSIVKRGENGGRSLRHDAAVRTMVGSEVGETRVAAFKTPLRPEWRRDHLRVDVLVQGKSSQRIWGAAQTTVR